MRAVREAGVAIMALGGGFAATPAIAKAPMYACKAGVDEATLNADESACFADASKAMKDAGFRPGYAYNPVTQGSVAGAVGAGLAQGFVAGIQSAKRANATLYDCMVAWGYSMRRMTGEDWKALKKLPPDARKARAPGWRTGPAPVHPEVPRDAID